MSKKKINLGCGSDYREGYLNVDKYSETGADLVWDLETFPWPIEDSSADEIVLRHVLEHLGATTESFLAIIKELYRISAPNASILIDVPHPLHTDFLGDPTHCRPIIPETLQLFNLDYAESLIRNKNIGTPLAKYIGVDFRIMDVVTHTDHDGSPRVYSIKLKVRKGKTAVIGNTAWAVGDLCMSLGAAHALKNAGYTVSFVVREAFTEIVSACPHVDYVITDPEVPHVEFAYAWYNLQREHQIDTLLTALIPSTGLSNVPNEAKSIDLVVPEHISKRMQEKYPGNNRIALHAVESLGKNKTWPESYWRELVNRLLSAGYEVVLVGRKNWCGTHISFEIPGAVSETELSYLETVALLKQCRVLVAGDTGPVQLAAATECGIVGLYSVTNPETKLPYRHGELGWNCIGIETTCPNRNCSKELVYGDYFNHWAVGSGRGDVTELVTNWCLNDKDSEDYLTCMSKITVDRVYDATVELYNKNKRITICDVGPGIGDVCMSLCAAHALHDNGYEVTFVTPKDFHELVEACPHVAEVTDVQIPEEVWLSPAWYQLQKRHQVDTLINACGLDASIIPASSKSLDISIPSHLSNRLFWNFFGTNRIAIHPGISKDASRTWSKEKWQALVNKLLEQGIEVISIGKQNWYGKNTVYDLIGVHTCYNLSALETIELLKHCRVLISADAGPIQLAGATECGIVGLYSVMRPEYRLPFRHGKQGWRAVGIETSCPNAYCFEHMVTDTGFIWSDRAHAQFNSGVSIAEVISGWCENESEPFSCMNTIDVDTVVDAALRLYKDVVLAITGPGIGDVCMGLGTAHSLHSQGYRVTIEAQPQFHELVLACPYVYAATNEDVSGPMGLEHIWLSAAWSHFQKGHQVDTMNKLCSLGAVSNEAKSIVVNIPDDISAKIEQKYPGNNRIVLHPAGRDLGKKWPVTHWQELANKLLADGFQVVCIGMDDWLGDATNKLTGVVDEFNLPPLETIALLQHCAVMVSACSGPIQLAGATDCGIVGLYSLMPPESRLPYRHGKIGWNAIGVMTDCPHAPCFEKLVEDTPFNWSEAAHQVLATNGQNLGELMRTWCPNTEAPYSCMPNISVDSVYNSIITLYGKQTIV